ncbi:L-threonylcarbamoyladenylate synthase [Adhaeribacter soli]|uniref:L-threonylcarbamoyladenylate synthase n=1 Tax=Adhaeribacter soli TaxID=2607655 RepID=A0A5N1IRT3_9BACT|nr:L-threonylcarbamoyladenylate synthase [Adhaeribacter soli]KAA9332621.1 threonylcarbamoyl-AMP synthase [Adhaeribacter soli]
MSKEIKEIHRVVDQLMIGNVILYPTDTVWGIGCDAENVQAVKRIYEIKERPEEKPFILLVADVETLKRYVKNVPENFVNLIQNQERPTTYIFNDVQNLPPEVISRDGSVAFRIPQDEFCHRLTRQFERAIVSTSANVSGKQSGGSFSDIPDTIKEKVDYMVAWRQEEEIQARPSRIVQLQPDGSQKVIRE